MFILPLTPTPNVESLEQIKKELEMVGRRNGYTMALRSPQSPPAIVERDRLVVNDPKYHPLFEIVLGLSSHLCTHSG
jgi:hypothetical protein